MMTKEEINILCELNKAFQERCKTICSILGPLDYDYYQVNSFIPYEDEILCIGYDAENYHICETFDVKFIWMTDEEIKKYVDDEIRRKEDEERKRVEKRNQDVIEKEIELYKELKEKYGDIV